MDEVGAGNQQLSQVSDPVFLLSLKLIFLLEQLGENLFFCRCGLCDRRHLEDRNHVHVRETEGKKYDQSHFYRARAYQPIIFYLVKATL